MNAETEKSVNEITISGHLQDAALRQTQNGRAVCGFTLVVIHALRSGEIRRQFLKCVAWEGKATQAAGMKANQKVRLIGRLITDSWQDKQTGEKKSVVKIVVDKIFPVENLEDVPNEKDAISRSAVTASAWLD